VAEQLYLAVELRCDLNDQKIDVPGCCNKNTLLEMDDNEAEQYLRKSVVRTEYGNGTIRFNDNFENADYR